MNQKITSRWQCPGSPRKQGHAPPENWHDYTTAVFCSMHTAVTYPAAHHGHALEP